MAVSKLMENAVHLRGSQALTPQDWEDCACGSELDPNWIRAGPELDPRMDPTWTRSGATIGPEMDSYFDEILNNNHITNGGTIGSDPGPILVPILVQFLTRFWSDSGADSGTILDPILARFWLRFCPNSGSDIGPGIGPQRIRNVQECNSFPPSSPLPQPPPPAPSPRGAPRGHFGAPKKFTSDFIVYHMNFESKHNSQEGNSFFWTPQQSFTFI